jgi:hypothetical protein
MRQLNRNIVFLHPFVPVDPVIETLNYLHMKKFNKGMAVPAMAVTLLFSLAFNAMMAQTSQFIIKKDTMTDKRHLQFDVYLKAVGPTFYYGMAQFKIHFNEALANGGTVTPSIVPQVTGLSNTVQMPKSVVSVEGGASAVRINPSSVPRKQESCSTVSNTGDGTLVCRVVLENTVDFKNVPHNFEFVMNGGGATAVFYMNEENLLKQTK